MLAQHRLNVSCLLWIRIIILSFSVSLLRIQSEFIVVKDRFRSIKAIEIVNWLLLTLRIAVVISSKQAYSTTISHGMHYFMSMTIWLFAQK